MTDQMQEHSTDGDGEYVVSSDSDSDSEPLIISSDSKNSFFETAPTNYKLCTVPPDPTNYKVGIVPRTSVWNRQLHSTGSMHRRHLLPRVVFRYLQINKRQTADVSKDATCIPLSQAVTMMLPRHRQKAESKTFPRNHNSQ